MVTQRMRTKTRTCMQCRGKRAWDISRVVINIGGQVYETGTETLRRFPKTLLGDPEKRSMYYVASLNQYFFDRSRVFFDAILFFYQSGGILRCPGDVAFELFETECRFFELPEEAIDRAKPIDFIARTMEDEEVVIHEERQSLRSSIWDVLQNPLTSPLARWFSITSLLAVVLSVLSPCLQSIPELVVKEVFEKNPWSIFELALNTFFLIEFLLSAVCAPNTQNFFYCKMTWIDIAAVFPYFAMLAVSKDALETQFLKILRMVRLGRMLRFSRHSKRISLIGKILVSCMEDLKTLLLCVFMIVVLAGSLMYNIEDNTDSDVGFTTIPAGIYWAIQTLFTIGYGDIVPVTYIGRVFSGAFMLFGASAVCIPLLSIIAKFQENWDEVK